MSVAHDVIAWAEKQVGYHEGRKDGHWDNIEKFADMVPSLGWAQGQAWCDTFVAACFTATGNEKLIPVSAGCDASRTAWKAKGRWSEYPAVGAQVIFGTASNATHTGIVVKYDAHTITTVEGNTNTNGSVEGDGVYRKVHQRTAAFVQGYGYPEYPEGIDSADPGFKGKRLGKAVAKPRPPKPNPVHNHVTRIHALVAEIQALAAEVAPGRTAVHAAVRKIVSGSQILPPS